MHYPASARRLAETPRRLKRPLRFAIRNVSAMMIWTLDASLREARFSYAVFTQEGPENIIRTIRFPETGWLEGDLGDLAKLARLVSVPQRAVEQASDNLQFGINQAATVLGELDNTARPNQYRHRESSRNGERRADAPHGLRDRR